MLQQLLYADEVRRLSDFNIELADVSDPEIQLAIRPIEQISQDSYDPTQFVDEEKQRILAAVEQKIAGREVVAPPAPDMQTSSNVVDLMEALRASLRNTARPKKEPEAPGTRKAAKRASTATTSVSRVSGARSRK